MHRVIETYLHNNEVGVLIELQCLNEASSKTADFKVLAKDLAMQVAASSPIVVDESDLSNITPTFDKYLHESLMGQSYIKNPSIKVSELITKVSNKLKEEIKVIRFVRYDTKEI